MGDTQNLKLDATSGKVEEVHDRFVMLSPSELIPHPENPRKHSRPQIRAIAKSIQRSGYTAPVVADKDKRILAGHGRREAALLLGLPTIPVIVRDDLTEEQGKAYMLADNKLTDRSSWDDNKVATILKELSVPALEFDLEATGFETPEIDFRIQSLDQDDAVDAADEFEVAAAPPTSMLGDLWHLDAHRLRCGNSLEEVAFASLLNNEKATAAIIDPPYNVRIHGHASGKGRTTHREFPMAVGEMNPKEFVDFLNRSLTSLRAHCAPGSLIYACRRPTSSSDTSKGFKIPYAIDAPIHQMFYLSAIRGRSATCEKSRDPFWSTDGSEVRAVNRHALGLSTPQA